MPVIHSFSSFLKEQVAFINGRYDCVLGTPVISEEQLGQVCKLHAVRVACNSLHKFYGTPSPLPLRKNKEHQYSIRKLAKEKYGSQVGEIYSVKTLVSIAADNGYCATAYTASHFDDYIAKIIEAIDRYEVPILFYDVDFNGEPAFAKSHREHAVVVAGYYRDKQNELGFIITQNGKHCFISAHHAYQSTNQLSLNRTPEKFDKHGKYWIDLFTKNRLPHDSEFLKSPVSKSRRAKELDKDDGGLRNKVLVIHKQPRLINAHSFWGNGLTSTESTRLFIQYLRREGVASFKC